MEAADQHVHAGFPPADAQHPVHRKIEQAVVQK
jgi:hypothetical protein